MEQAILQVSLKEYKKSIDDLRASLLSLDSTSEEYKTTVDEIRDRQQKLNEVMSAGKSDVDAVAGSYNALQRQMAALKKEWKSMEIGTEEWKAMAAQIDNLNNQLKDADALTGNFQRNVGDYANAFGAAFDKAAGELGKIPGPLGTIFKVTKDLIPAIKAANKTATTGLAGVKKALVSTGIGALVVAVGLLVSHWGDLMRLIRGGQNDYDRLVENNDKLNEKFEEENFNMEQQVRIMESQGVATDKIIREKLKLIRAQIAQKTAQLQETKQTYDAIKAHTWLGRVLRGEQGDYKKLSEELDKQKEELKQMSKNEVKLSTDLTVTQNNNAKKRQEEAKKEEEEANKILEDLKNRNKTEEQLLTEKYNKEKALLEKYHKDTKALEKQYQQDLIALRHRAAKSESDAQDNLFEAVMGGRIQNASYWEDVKAYYTNKLSELEKLELNAYENLTLNDKGKGVSQNKRDKIFKITTGYDSEAEFINEINNVRAIIREASNNIQKELINDYLADTSTLVEGTGRYFVAMEQNARAQLQAVREVGRFEYETQEQFEKRLNDAFENLMNAEKALAEFKDITTEAAVAQGKLTNNLAKGFDNATLAAEKATAELSLENYYAVMTTYLDNIKADWKEAFNGLEVGSEKWMQTILANIMYFPEDARSTFLQKLMDVRDAENAIIQDRKATWDSFYNSVSSVMSSINDIWTESIQYRKQQLIDEGGKTEEEANAILYKEFENNKTFQISMAVINTIAGALGAFMGITKDTGGWGIAAATAEAAAVTAAGIAQIQKIKNTSIGKTDVDNSSISVSPQLGDYTPQSTANLTSASDQDNLVNALQSANISVSVTDINRVQNRVRVREGESRF